MSSSPSSQQRETVPVTGQRWFARCVICGRGYWQDEAKGDCIGGKAIGEGCGGMTLPALRPLIFWNKTGGPTIGLNGKLPLERKAEMEARGWTFNDAPTFDGQGPIWWGWEPQAKKLWDAARAKDAEQNRA